MPALLRRGARRPGTEACAVGIVAGTGTAGACGAMRGRAHDEVGIEEIDAGADPVWPCVTKAEEQREKERRKMKNKQIVT